MRHASSFSGRVGALTLTFGVGVVVGAALPAVHVYWIIRDDACRFAPGSGLEHLNERACPDCWLVHPPGECP